MTQEQIWGDLVAKTTGGIRPEDYQAPVSGTTSHYPLLGLELPGSFETSKVSKPWRIRLRLCETVSPEEFVALTEGVEELGFSPELSLDGFQLQDGVAQVFIESEGLGSQRADSLDGRVWSLADEAQIPHEPFKMWERQWKQGPRQQLERVVEPDGLILRNLSLLARLRSAHLDVDSWVVRSSASADGTADGLIADTLAYWSGAVAGVDVLEVAQQPEEDFASLWARLNVLRVLRWEAGLAAVPQATDGSGLFQNLCE